MGMEQLLYSGHWDSARHILLQDLPMAIMCYVIAFGDIVGGTAFLEDTKRYREDEYIDVNPDRTNMCCGFRNLIELSSAPPAPCRVLCGPP